MDLPSSSSEYGHDEDAESNAELAAPSSNVETEDSAEAGHALLADSGDVAVLGDSSRHDSHVSGEEDEENGAEEDDDEEDEEEHDEEEDEDVRTFLEFTGSTDRDRARQYLVATEGNLEEAVNLFLTGAPPPALAPGSPSRRGRESSGGGVLLGGHGETTLPHLLAHLEALASGGALRVGGDGGGGDSGNEEEGTGQMDALLSDLTEHDVNLSALARSLMVGSGFSEFVRMAQHQSQGRDGSSGAGESSVPDEDTYENNSTTLSEAKARLENVTRGQSEAISIVGAHTTRSVSSFTTYMEANLISAVCSALNRASSDSAIRVLQVIESITLMLCRGLNDAERLTVGWFVPPRRMSMRRGRPKQWTLETFSKTIAPKGDLALARRLWRRRELEPSFKNNEGDGLLALACEAKAPVEFIRFLIVHWGLNPEEGSGSLGTPRSIVEEARKDEEDEEKVRWADQVLTLFNNITVMSVDEKTLEERRLASYPLPAVDQVPEDVCSSSQWSELIWALLKFISRSSNVAAVHRALEIVVLMVEESPSPVPIQQPNLSGLVAVALAPECRDKMVVRSGLRILNALAKSEASEPLLIDLCRSSTIHRTSRRVFDNEEDSQMAKKCCEMVLKRVAGKCDPEGRPARVMQAVKALKAKSEDALSLLSLALADITTFEFDQTNLAEAANAYFSDPSIPSQALLQALPEQPSSPSLSSTAKKFRGSSAASQDDDDSSVGEIGTGELEFCFATVSSGNGVVRFKRARQDGRSMDDDRRSLLSGEGIAPIKKTTILDKLVECAQAILSEAVPAGFPQIVHDFPGKEDGVRALLNTIPLKLCATGALKEAFPDRASEFLMHALPLTSKRELEKQVLRTGLVANQKYIEYCRQLVGKKIALVMPDGSAELHLCTGFDGRFLSHRMKSLVSSTQHWRILTTSRYAVLERVFDSDDTSELASHDAQDSDCPAGGALQAADFPLVLDGESEGGLRTDSAAAFGRIKINDDAARASSDSPVAVWWEGSAELRPGWRLGITEPNANMDSEFVKVTFPSPGLIFDDEIRIGSLVRLVASDEVNANPDLADHVGEVVRVISIQGTQVTTYGLGGHACSIAFLAKVRDAEEDGSGRKPQVGEEVGVLSPDGTRFERGIVISDDGSRVPFTIRDLDTGETRKCLERDVFALSEEREQALIPSRRIVPVSSIGRINNEHTFGVYIVPGSVAGDVPDFITLSAQSPQPRVLFTITSDSDGSSADDTTNWSSDDEDTTSTSATPRPSSTAPPQPKFNLGARIEARFAGKSKWYKGHISRVNADGTYDVAYDDGDTERCVLSSYVALAPSSSADDESGHRRSGSSSSSSGVLLDFRKTFPTQAGRALFDALRKEDHVLKTEYNFVTRGFEHQPNFYNSFSATLEQLGAGVFAQFQTYQQAETLFLRCNKFAKDGQAGDRVHVRYEPDRRAHPTVIREILSAFARAEFQRSSSSSLSNVLPSFGSPPKPGSRALVRVGPEAKSQALIDASKTSAWVPATVLAFSSSGERGNQGLDHPSVIVCTDDGFFFRRVPPDMIKEAPTRVAASPASQPTQSSQPQSRRLTFRSGRLGTQTLGGASSNPTVPPRLDTPIELTRQFSVFGQTNALRHITVGERSPAIRSDMALATHNASVSMPVFHLGSGGAISPSPNTNSNVLASLPTRPENQPPKLIVEIEPMVNVSNKAISLIDESNDEDSSVFRVAFEMLFNYKKNLNKSNVLKAKWNFIANRLKLAFRTKVIFPGDQEPPSSPSKPVEEEKGEDKLKQNAKDAFGLLVTLYGRSQGSTSVDWTNQALSTHFRNQLKDPLSVATRVLPRWVQTIPVKGHFLFLERDRIAFIKAVTLGVSRSIAWLQEEVTGYQSKKRELAQLTVEISQLFNQAEPNEAKYKRLSQLFEKLDDEVKQIKENKFIGQLRQDLVKVDNNNLLEDAMALMENHAGERSELVVQFVGDTGAGEGVTHEFYGAVAAELQKVTQNRNVPMWADPERATRTSHTDGQQQQQQDLIRPLGLFPQPLLPSRANRKAVETNQAVVDRFRFLGRLMGQALLDEKTVPIPLAVEFFELLKEEDKIVASAKRTVSASSGSLKNKVSPQRIIKLIESDDASAAEDLEGMEDVDSSSGIVSILSRLVRTMDDPANTNRIREAAQKTLVTRLDELGLRFVDPSQPMVDVPRLDTTTTTTTTATATTKGSQEGEEMCNPKEATEIFDNVPLVDAPYPSVLAFANEWSQKGKTKAQIDRALESAGHSKIARWRVLQATQAARVISATTSVVEEDRYDISTELVPDGRRIVVDLKNVREYLRAVEAHWTGSGIRPQIQATRMGLVDALGDRGATTLLKLFSADALSRMFCGEQEVKWDEQDSLLGFLLPKGEYTSSSREIKMLVECLKKMTQTERSQFLSFCTALPRVPSSGLPQIKIFPPTKSRVTALVLSNRNGEPRSPFQADLAEWNGEDPSTWPRLNIGDRVMLAEDYRDIEDAALGPLQPGEIGEVTSMVARAQVKDWWYHPRALRKVEDEEDDDEDENDEEQQHEEEEEEEETAAQQEEDHAGEEEVALMGATATTGTTPDYKKPTAIPKSKWFEEGDIVSTNEARGVVSSWDASTNTLQLQENPSNRSFRSGRRLIIRKKSGPMPPGTFSIRNVVEQCEVVQSPPFLRPKATTCVMTLYLPTGYENADHMLQVFREAFEDAKLGGLQDA